MKDTLLLTLAAIAVVAGCGGREDAASSPDAAASPPAATIEQAPVETVPAEPAPAGQASAEAPPPSAATPAVEPSTDGPAAEADACNAERVQNLVGELYTPELGEQARVTAGARVERALRPGQIVTMEFRADRLSFTLDEKGRISRVGCG
jgi:hypothetical protein